MKNFFLIAITLVALAACTTDTPDTGVSPGQLALDLTHSDRFETAEQVADRIIRKDPSLRLIDVRKHEEYDAFSLPGAINIPLANILDEASMELLDCERYVLVFYSNDDLDATKAWMLSRRLNCRQSHILQGGLNQWTESILNPAEPAATASAEEMDLYRFRKAVCQYFIGGSEALEAEKYEEIRQPVLPKKTIEVAPKKKKAVEEEGC